MKCLYYNTGNSKYVMNILQVTDEMFNVHNFLDESDPNQLDRRKYLGKC